MSGKEGVCLHICALLGDDRGAQYLLKRSPKFFHTLLGSPSSMESLKALFLSQRQRRPALTEKDQAALGRQQATGKNYITVVYLLAQQFSGKKLLSSAGRNDHWSRNSVLRN